jgi:hypothetical protein
MVGMESNNGDGQNFDAMVKQAGADFLKEGVYIAENGKVKGAYKDLDSALSEYVSKVKEMMAEKSGYTKPTLVAQNFGNDTPTRTV